MDTPTLHPALERHYTLLQVAELWGWSDETVRRVFRDEPGVLRTALPSLRTRKRQNFALRIPESVLVRVHERLTTVQR
jgi:AraC-like DNA-binding protein